MTARILVARTSVLHSVIARGIQNALLSRPDCVVATFNPTKPEEERLEDILTWNPDGILVLSPYSASRHLLDLPGIPKVMVDLNHDKPEGVTQAGINYRELGYRAADYLMAKRVPHFGFALSVKHSELSHAVRARVEGFTERIAEAGMVAHRIEVTHSGIKPWYAQPDLEERLKELPKPIGIYCTQDVVGVRIIENCHRLGIQVPTEVSVLGTGNSMTWCECMRPFLSSIAIPIVEMGRQAGRMMLEDLKTLEAGETPVVRRVEVKPGEVVERQSTGLRHIPDPAIARAVNFLQDHALKGAGVDDAARAAGLNRRTMERGFRQYLDLSPKKFIDQFKTDYAKRLLSETDLQMLEVAETCGFTQDHFVTFFKRHTGLTPSAYRKKFPKPLEE